MSDGGVSSKFKSTPDEQSHVKSSAGLGEHPNAKVVTGSLSPVEREMALKSLRADIDVGLQQIREGMVTVDSDAIWAQIEARANQRFKVSEQESRNVRS